MTTLYDAHSDEEFERSLLDSAADDRPTQSPAAAWTQLSAALAHASAESLNANSSPDGKRKAPATTLGADARTPRAIAALRQGAVWLLVGAGGGSLITALWLSAHDSRTPAAPVARDPSAVVASSERAAAASEVAPSEPQAETTPTTPGLATGAAVQPPAASDAQVLTVAPPTPTANGSWLGHAVAAAPLSRREARAPLPDASQAASAPTDTETSNVNSSLAAEVVALDIARSALRAGLAARALRLIDRYHKEFPLSALAPDAEVVALEALAALHNHSQLTDRANAFLERYPRDPHGSRVLGFLQAERAH